MAAKMEHGKTISKGKKIEMYDSVLLDLKDFMTNLLNRTTCLVLGVQQSG